MCRYIKPAGWACGCQIRPSFGIERPFLKRCDRSLDPGQGQRCRGTHTYPITAKIPWLCHDCYDQVIQNHLRPLYGLTGSTVSSVLGELDRVDPHRDILAGTDLAVRNQLDANLQRLEANIIATTRKFNECRDETLEAFFGTDVYCHMRLDLIADQGQTHCFIPHNQPVASSMLTALECRERELPLYERDLIPNPYPVLPPGATMNANDGLPEYSDICPYNSLDEFQPLDCDCNDDAVSDGASSASSDCYGEGMKRIEIFGRLRRKLRAEFAELQDIDKPSGMVALSTSRAPNPSMTYTPAQQAQYSTVGFGSVQERRARRQQLRKQIQTVKILLSEELRIVNFYKNLVLLRTAVMNSEARMTSHLVEAKELLQLAVREILQNRVNHSLSELLLPLNGTDPSRCHAVHLLPEAHRSMFAPRAFGFPANMVKDQLESYTAAPGHPWRDGSDEDPEENDDVDAGGKLKETPPVVEPIVRATRTPVGASLGSGATIPESSGDQREDYVPVTQLKTYPVEEDEYTPKVRILRLPRQGLVFELVMPRDPPQYLNPNVPTESNPLEAIPNERLSLVALIEAVRAQLEGAESTDVDDLPAIISSASPPAHTRLTLDMTSVDRDPELSQIVREVRARSPANTWAELAGLSTLEEAVTLAIRLDGLIVRPTHRGIARFRVLVTGTSYVPRRFHLTTTDQDLSILAVQDDSLLDPRSRPVERDHDRRRRADEQEEGRRLLQVIDSDEADEQSSNGGVELPDNNDDDEASDDELDYELYPESVD